MAEVGSARVSESQQKSNYRRSKSGLGLGFGPGEGVGGTGREKPGHEVGTVKLIYVYTHTYICIEKQGASVRSKAEPVFSAATCAIKSK